VLGANTTAMQMAAPVWKILDQPMYIRMHSATIKKRHKKYFEVKEYYLQGK